MDKHDPVAEIYALRYGNPTPPASSYVPFSHGVDAPKPFNYRRIKHMGKNIARPPRITPAVQVSYPKAVFAAQVFEAGDTPKFSIVIMLKKEDKEAAQFLSGIHADAQSALAEHWPDEAKRPRRPIVGEDLSLIKDGDTARNQKGIPLLEKNPEYAGHYIIRASTTSKPGIVDRNRQPILDSNELNGGDYCKINLNVYTYEGQKSSGVTCGLNGVQKWAEGEHFGGGRPPIEEMFEADSGSEDPLNYPAGPAGGADVFAPEDDIPF